jgi:hypothetical protein
VYVILFIKNGGTMIELILIVLVLVMIRGTILVFSESFWLALVMMFVLMPLLLLWILFRGIVG